MFEIVFLLPVFLQATQDKYRNQKDFFIHKGLKFTLGQTD